MSEQHRTGIMAVFNYYVEHSTAAFPESVLPESFYDEMLADVSGFPAYALVDKESRTVVGFCDAKPYIASRTFAGTYEMTYFIMPEYTGKGIGGECLLRLENEARQMGAKRFIAEISSENKESISFHEKHGFTAVGELHDIGEKFGRRFGIVYMEKMM